MLGKKYFYRRTVHPGDCKEYNYALGIAVYNKPQSKGRLLFSGTEEEFKEFQRKQRRNPSRQQVRNPITQR